MAPLLRGRTEVSLRASCCAVSTSPPQSWLAMLGVLVVGAARVMKPCLEAVAAGPLLILADFARCDLVALYTVGALDYEVIWSDEVFLHPLALIPYRVVLAGLTCRTDSL